MRLSDDSASGWSSIHTFNGPNQSTHHLATAAPINGQLLATTSIASGINLGQPNDPNLSTSSPDSTCAAITTTSGYTPLASLLNSATTNLQNIAIGSNSSHSPSHLNHLNHLNHHHHHHNSSSIGNVLTRQAESFHYVSPHPNAFEGNSVPNLYGGSHANVSTNSSPTLSMSGFATLFGASVDLHPSSSSSSHHPMHSHHQPRFNPLTTPKMEFGPSNTRPVLLRQNSAQEAATSSTISDRSLIINNRKLSTTSDNGNGNEPCCCLWVQCNLVFGDQRELVSQICVKQENQSINQFFN